MASLPEIEGPKPTVLLTIGGRVTVSTVSGAVEHCSDPSAWLNAPRHMSWPFSVSLP